MSLNARASTWWEPGGPLAVGGRWALPEHPRLAPGRAPQRLAEDVALAPALQHPLLQVGEGGLSVDVAVRLGQLRHGPRILGPGGEAYALLTTRGRARRGGVPVPDPPASASSKRSRAVTGEHPRRQTVLAPVSGRAPR